MGKAKTRKSLAKRLRVTKKGKVLARKPGQNHFQAKKSGGEKTSKKRRVDFNFSRKLLSRNLEI